MWGILYKLRVMRVDKLWVKDPCLSEVPHSPAHPPGLQQGLPGLPDEEEGQWGSLAPLLGPPFQIPSILTFSPFVPGGPTTVCGEHPVSCLATHPPHPYPTIMSGMWKLRLGMKQRSWCSR